MLGTLNGALEVRGVTMEPGAIRATVKGTSELQGKIPVLTAVEIHYRLRTPRADREKVDRALKTHQAKCPTAQSLAGAVEVSWTADRDEF